MESRIMNRTYLKNTREKLYKLLKLNIVSEIFRKNLEARLLVWYCKVINDISRERVKK